MLDKTNNFIFKMKFKSNKKFEHKKNSSKSDEFKYLVSRFSNLFCSKIFSKYTRTEALSMKIIAMLHPRIDLLSIDS